MNLRFLIGIDDTDSGDSLGTGGLARELEAFLLRKTALTSLGVTRHQHLAHPEIDDSSDNNSACIELDGKSTIAELATLCREFLAFLHHPGADPGLCVTVRRALSEQCREFGCRTKKLIVDKKEALQLAGDHGILLEELGRAAGLGVIGALGAVCLRSGGNDGRFISLEGIRRLKGILTVEEIVRESAISSVVDENGERLGDFSMVDTRGWTRPVLRDHEPVLPVEWEEDHFRTGEPDPGLDN